MPLNVDIAGELLAMVNINERKTIMEIAKKNDNKKLRRKIVAFQYGAKKLEKGKFTKKLPEKLVTEITSYL
jgi:hypothetical protein